MNSVRRRKRFSHLTLGQCTKFSFSASDWDRKEEAMQKTLSDKDKQMKVLEKKVRDYEQQLDVLSRLSPSHSLEIRPTHL